MWEVTVVVAAAVMNFMFEIGSRSFRAERINNEGVSCKGALGSVIVC